MPDRVIRDELLESERWLSLKDNADRLAYVALILRADDYGNFSGERFRLMRLWRDFGITSVELVAKTLAELIDHELIGLYDHENKHFLHIMRFRNMRRYWSRRFPQSPYDEQITIQSKQKVTENIDAGLAQDKRRTSGGVGVGEGELPPRAKRAVSDDGVELRRATWQAYSDAYEFRHGAPPIRDAKANSAIKAFCKSVPAIECAQVAAFYVQNSNSFYVSKKHPPTLLASDAAKLRTEWVTGQQTTQTEAMQADKTAARKNVFMPLINEAKQREKSTK